MGYIVDEKITTICGKCFQDSVTYNAVEKTALSVRDGVIEYYGQELGLEPYDKTFFVYRSPATIANAAMAMNGIPLTKEHVPLDEVAPQTGSIVTNAMMVDFVDGVTNTRVAVKNSILIGDGCKDYLDECRQLSLGYHADLVPHAEYDFEQLNIIPHHLAVVPEGRCGAICSFIDKNKYIENKENGVMTKLHQAFRDQEGESIDIDKVIEIAMALPEAIRALPVEKLAEIVPALQEIIDMARVDENGEVGTKIEAVTDEEPPKEENEEDENKAAYADAVKKLAADFADKAVKEYAVVIDKARSFLDESYDYKAKTARDVMRDALATQTSETFADEELPLAFKLLRKTSDYKSFGDNQAKHKLDEIANKEL